MEGAFFIFLVARFQAEMQLVEIPLSEVMYLNARILSIMHVLLVTVYRCHNNHFSLSKDLR